MEGPILLVEDNPDHETLTLRALTKAGLGGAVVVARDGAEALNYLFGKGHRGESHLPSLVLLDLNLPKVDGLQVLQQMRADERTMFVPVVVLTSSDEDSDLISSYKHGASSYIRKPVDQVQLVAAARQLGLHLMQNDSREAKSGQ